MDITLTRRALVARSALAGAGTWLASSALLPPALAQNAAPAATPGPGMAGSRPGMARLLANENPYGPSPRARAAVQAALAEAWQYPMAQAQVLRRALAAKEGVPENHVMVADGSGEVLRIAALMFTRERREVVAAVPTFTFLQEYARTLGATIREVPVDGDLGHDLPAMARTVTAETGIVYVCNPNNPTGTLVPGGELRPFVQEVSRRVPVLVDEAYLDLWDDVQDHTCIQRVLAGDPVIVARTFSKLHGLAGLRIGYAIAPPALIQRLEAGRMSLLNAAGLAAATASLADGEFQAFSRARIREALDITQGALKSLGLPSTPTRGNFVFFDTRRPPGEFAAAMRQAGFLVGRPFAPLTGWCRVSMGTVEQMRSFAAALAGFYGGQIPA